MRTQDFSYKLPDELIARAPTAERSASRLLELDGSSGQYTDRLFTDVVGLVEPGDLLVFNDTKVIPARIFGQKRSGGRIEVMVERVLDTHKVLAHVRASKAPKVGAELLLEDETVMIVKGRHEALFELDVQGDEAILSILERIGHMPLPPYIDREDTLADRQRYQTVYGRHTGAVAAPTAGLHFDEAIFQALEEKGVRTAFVTLHVGAGTFSPVRVDDIAEHKMHSEWATVSEDVVHQIQETWHSGKRVIAVGTTSVRSLETAAQSGVLKPFEGETDIFIYPGYAFQVVDAMITNFHMPESTLMMLVSAFAGHQHIMCAYQHAIDQKYRFFSYGDAMLLHRQK